MPAVHVPENDPKKQEQKSQRNESMHAYAARRESEIESLRELRQQLAYRMKGTLPPFDEFTIFGLPSDAGQVETVSVRDCMTRDDSGFRMDESRLVKPPKKLLRDIDELEHKLRPPMYAPPNRYEQVRPMSARLAPRVSPRHTFATEGGQSVRFSTGTDTRPLTSRSAYRSAGLDGHACSSLLPRTRAKIEQWSSLPKYEEQMMLNHLKSQKDQLGHAPLWKLKRYQMVPPRV